MGAAAAIAMRLKEREVVDDFRAAGALTPWRRAVMIGSVLALIFLGLAVGFLKW